MRILVITLASLTVLIFDQLSKYIFATSYNTDFMLGIPGPSTALMVVLMIVGLVLIVWKLSPSWAVGLIVGGGMSNAVDRITLDGVRDFIPLSNVLFNVADIAVLIGVIGWFYTQRREVRR